MGSYCRLCFNENVTKSSPLVPVFGDFGTSLKLQKKIQSRLHIYVDPDDYLPTTVCIFCCGQLEKFEMFLKKAHKSQNKLLKAVQNSKDTLIEPDTTIPQQSLMDTDEEPRIAEPRIAKEENHVAVIELSDDSADDFFDLTTDYDSDVEFVETDIKPLPPLLQPKMDENDDDFENVFEELSPNEPDIKFTKLHKSIQFGTSLLDYTRAIETKFVTENPGVDFQDVCIYTARASDKGSKISMNTCTDKGVQIETNCRYRTRSIKEMSRVNWTPEQKIIMKERLSYHYMYGTIPSKKDTMNFLETAGLKFDGVTEDRVRRFFTNRKYYKERYQRKKRH